MRKSFYYARLFALVLFAFCLTLSTSAFAQTESAGEWEFSITPYVWLAGINGESTVNGKESSTDADFPDIFAKLDIAGMLHLEARKSRWALFTDAVYLDLSADAKVGPIEAELGTQGAIVELGGMYRLLNKPLGNDTGRVLLFDVIAGGRYISLQGDIDFQRLPDLERSKNWIDPIVGARAIVDLPGKSVVLCRLDFGGFGIGDASDFTWNALAAWGYDLSDSWRLWLGYRALGVDYETGTAPEDLKFKLTVSGPVIGAGYRF